jgi:hypothetical protein
MRKKPRPSGVSKPKKLRPDVAETAFRVMQEAIGEAPKTPPPSERPKDAEAVRRGRKGGRRGGAARKNALSDVERSEIARKAAKARWQKPTEPKKR